MAVDHLSLYQLTIEPGTKDSLAVTEVPVPEPGPGMIQVRIQACGVCHTDLHAAEGDWPVKPTPPFIPGHEGVGEVVALGEGVADLQVGDLDGAFDDGQRLVVEQLVLVGLAQDLQQLLAILGFMGKSLGDSFQPGLLPADRSIFAHVVDSRVLSNARFGRIFSIGVGVPQFSQQQFGVF